MVFVDNQGITDPRLNLALEEFLLRHVPHHEPLLLFYVNEPSVIIGRNQNVLEEVDLDFVQAKGIHVVRRLSGGGAVYHDSGNLNYSFITNGREHMHDYLRFIEPVVRVLRALGVPAEFKAKSDIVAAGKKISGNAQYAAAGRLLSHGTLLYDTDLEQLRRAIRPRRLQIESRAVASVRSSVVNISALRPLQGGMQAFKAALLRGLFGDAPAPVLPATAVDWTQVRAIAADRYQRWEWNIGRSPAFVVHKREPLAAGQLDARLAVAGGRIQTVRLSGSLSDPAGVAGLEEALAAGLTGVRYEREALAAALAAIDLHRYASPQEQAVLLRLLY